MIGLYRICILLTFVRGVLSVLPGEYDDGTGSDRPIYANIRRPNTTRIGRPRLGHSRGFLNVRPPIAPKPVNLPPPPPPIVVPSSEQYQMDGEMDLPPPPPPIRTTSLGQRPMVMRPVNAPPPPPIRTTSLGQYQTGEIPQKPQRGVPRDFDDLMDGFADDEDDDDDDDIDDGDEIIRCKVEAKRPYSVSPTITVTGIRDRFNALLIGYDTHMDEKRANKASLYGWSSPKTPSSSGVAKFDFDLDYVSILPQGGIPLSYCALIFVPPVVPKFDTQSVFAKPAMSLARFIASEEHLVKALKKKNKRVTSCCFVAYPMVSKR